ncbi:hypothetical protein NMG60_11028990 [Bertholletia excelsa]
MADDWDLHAIVRGFASSSSSAVAQPPENPYVDFPDPPDFRTTQSNEVLQGLFKPLFVLDKFQLLSPPTPPFSPLSVFGDLQDLSPPPPPPPPREKLPEKRLVAGSRVFVDASSTATASTSATANTITNSRSKRRKNVMKKVCQVPAEGLSSDKWSWRKYGQKPIKGSPYPRGYYRCSTSKGCLARKQVERSKSDPGTFIVTYTADHNHPMPTHRNSLAGSTRQSQRPVTSLTASASDTSKIPCSPSVTACDASKTPSSPISPAIPSPPTRKIEGEENEDDELGISDMAIEDDFFEGLEELTGEAAGERFSGHFSGGLSFPWLGQCNSAATTAAGGC